MDDTAPTASQDIESSAGPLVAGLVALFLAAVCVVIGQMQAFSYDGYGDSSGFGWLITGALLGLVGAVLSIYGAYLVASHVDNLVRAQRGLPVK